MPTSKHLSHLKPFYLFAAVLMLCFTSANAQRNFIPGYMVNLKGDTVKGFINYREWEINPKKVEFRQANDQALQMIMPANTNGFGVNDREYYKKAIVKIYTSPVRTSDLPTSVDTSSRIDTVFLKALVTGKKVNLYSYNFDVKQVFYIIDNATGTITPLKQYLYVDESHNIQNVDIFKSQLMGKAMTYQPENKMLLKKIANANYEEDDLADIIAMLNGYSSAKTLLINNRGIRPFIGAGAGVSNFKFNGEYAPFPGTISSNSLTPLLSAGVDLLLNKYTQKYVLRIEVNAANNQFSLTDEERAGKTNSLNFKYISFGFTPQLLYNLYAKKDFKIFVDGGLGFNFYSYNKYYYEAKYALGGTVVKTERFPDFENFVLSIQFKSGIQMKKNVQLFVSYIAPYNIANYTIWSAKVTTFGGGINYLFN